MHNEVLLGEHLDTLLTIDVVIPGLVRVSTVTLDTGIVMIVLVIILGCNIYVLVKSAYFLGSRGSTISRNVPFFFFKICTVTQAMLCQPLLFRETCITIFTFVGRTN